MVMHWFIKQERIAKTFGERSIFAVVVIIQRVTDPQPPAYRPVPHSDSPGMHPALDMLMKQSWSEQPNERPSFDYAMNVMRHINKGK
jgi:hypothetical protein